MNNIFLDYANSDVTYKAYTSTDGRGAVTYVASVTVKAYIWYKTRKLRDLEGKEIISNITLYTNQATIERDCYTVDGIDYTIKGITKLRNLEGSVEGYEVFL